MSTTRSSFLSYDPVLPSSPEDEQLTPVPTSHNTPGSFASTQADTGDSPSTAGTPQTSSGQDSQHPLSAGFEYPGMEASDFDNDYLFEAKFADLPVTEGNTDFNYFQEPGSAATTTGRSEDPSISRRSTGIATLSSHLMSPVLTDSSSPGSPIEFTRSAAEQRLLGGGAMSQMSSQSTAFDSPHPSSMQKTPAPTSSSVDLSPEPGRDLGQFAAPLVHVESYSRDSSPLRITGLMNETGNKRSRDSRLNLQLAASTDNTFGNAEYDEPYNERNRSQVAMSDSNLTAKGRSGLGPLQRDQLQGDLVMSLEEQTQKAELDAKNEQVSKWLSVSDAGLGGPAGSTSSRRHKTSQHRPRAKSTSGPNELQADAFVASRGLRAAQDAQLPGPGALLVEESEEEDDEDGSVSYAESPPASIDSRNLQDERYDDTTALASEEPRPQDAYPWIDPIYFPSQQGTVGQPETSNTAMMRFAKRAKDIETASRAATWGTNCRRLSDGDLQRVFGNGGLFSRLSISKDKEKDKDKDEWRQFKETVEQAALKLLPKRNNSSARRKQSEPIKPTPRDSPSSDGARKDSLHKRKESLQSLHERKESLTASFKRMPSVNKRPKSPRINTSTSGLVASVTNIATLGANGPVSPTGTHSPTGKWGALKHARERLSRHSSHDPAEPSLTELWTQQGGPPLPTLSSAPKEKDAPGPPSLPLAEDDEETDEVTNDRAVSMSFEPRHDMIIPTFDGFKMNVRDVNPRLPVWLVERLGQEQLRRYKKLVEFKVKHIQARQLDNCSSGSHCADKGGVPTYFPAKGTQKEPVLSHTGFTTASTGEAYEDEEAVADGVVTDAQFPAGVPMPPARRLPAEFECPLCFTVKKFYKPSDWSKHVHEDLQPFTCTFRTCPDPKSFKRKADWVRHENERHRQLEWWQCTEEGCAHQCFRRDNFVQHLVREHKMPEPKAKTTKPNKPAVRGPAKQKGRANKVFANDVASEDKVLLMVETCRHETTKSAIDEPCPFCGNVCNSYKKLTVHLARHMEQISMPVLELVKSKDVTPDTIVSPIEAKLPQVMISSSEQPHYPREAVSISSFDHSMDGSAVMQDLPGAFQPLRNGPNFPPSDYNTRVHWSHSNGRTSQISTQMSSAYNGGMDGSWTSNPAYGSTRASSYHPLHGGQGGYVQEQPIPNVDMYPHMNGNSSHGLPIQYNNGQSFQVGVDSTPHFSAPQWSMEHNVPTSQAHQVAVPMPYDDTKSAMSLSQNPRDVSLYHGDQPQQQQHQQFYSQY